MNREDKAKIKRLVHEGKQISAIQRHDFPNSTYNEIMEVAWGEGIKSAQGTQSMITTRLNRLKNAGKKDERKELVAEIKGLAETIYYRLKSNQKKLNKIRRTMET